MVEETTAHRELHSWTYIQGAGDDEENWAKGLTSEVFWENKSEILLTSDHPSVVEEIATECMDDYKRNGLKSRSLNSYNNNNNNNNNNINYSNYSNSSSSILVKDLSEISNIGMFIGSCFQLHLQDLDVNDFIDSLNIEYELFIKNNINNANNNNNTKLRCIIIIRNPNCKRDIDIDDFGYLSSSNENIKVLICYAYTEKKNSTVQSKLWTDKLLTRCIDFYNDSNRDSQIGDNDTDNNIDRRNILIVCEDGSLSSMVRLFFVCISINISI
jgi:hypothetical protein